MCVARRVNAGRHLVLPLHADISVRARRIGFDYLTPILWHKISNAQFEAGPDGGGFLGKPYEPNAIVKNDVEYILMLRKHGRYRSPSDEQRAPSRLTKDEQSRWFRPIWSDIAGIPQETIRPRSPSNSLTDWFECSHLPATRWSIPSREPQQPPLRRSGVIAIASPTNWILVTSGVRKAASGGKFNNIAFLRTVRVSSSNFQTRSTEQAVTCCGCPTDPQVAQ